MSRKLSGKWRTECLNTGFPQSLFVGHIVELKKNNNYMYNNVRQQCTKMLPEVNFELLKKKKNSFIKEA